jgi:ribonuclease P protein subunit POP4
MRTPENILRHELIGLTCRVNSSSNAFNTGISGKIIDETMKTIIIEKNGERKNIEKKDSKFEVKVRPSELRGWSKEKEKAYRDLRILEPSSLNSQYKTAAYQNLSVYDKQRL